MTLNAKTIKQQQLLKIFNNPIILFYHYNNVNTKNWRYLKSECAKIKSIKTLVTKNRITRHFLENNFSEILLDNNMVHKKKANKLSQLLPDEIFCCFDSEKNKIMISKNDFHRLLSLLEGSTFLIACQSVEQLTEIYKNLNKFSSFLFLGSIIADKVLKQNTKNNKNIIEIQTDDTTNYCHAPFLQTESIPSTFCKHNNIFFAKKDTRNENIATLAKLYTHLDVEKLIQLNKDAVGIDLIKNLQFPINCLCFSIFQKPHYNLVALLEYKKNLI